MRTISYANSRLLSVAEVADRLGLTRGSVYRKVAAGELPATRLGDGLAPLRVSEQDLADWLDAHRTDAPPEAA
jgi:excisionase family DNA binding protein